MKQRQYKHVGFTLLELLLVLAIISMLIFLMAGYFQQQTLQSRIDRTTQQMQQVLNAGLAFYVQNGMWPFINPPSNNPTCLFGDGSSFGNSTAQKMCQTQFLIPNSSNQEGAQILSNPWGNPYHISATGPNKGQNACDPAQNPIGCSLFFVFTKISVGAASAAIATTIAGKLPNSYTSNLQQGTAPPEQSSTCTNNDNCYVVAGVNIPGTNLNNAAAVNFAGLYHHGGCVPVPSCPLGTTPQIMVVPVSVSGISYPTPSSTGQPEVYPISSFTAYATKQFPISGTQLSCTDTAGSMPQCSAATNVGTGPVSGQFWRVCLSITTENGNVWSTNTASGSATSGSTGAWGQYVTLMAMTRCAIENEPAGSDYTRVFGN